MRKNIFGRQFKRDKNERTALFKSLMSALIISERIKTTEQKAKSIKGTVEKLVTKAKKGNAVKQVFDKYLTAPAIDKLLTSVAPRFVERPGGYTRIIRLEKRFSDRASMVLLEWVEGPIEKGEEVAKVSKGKKKESKEEIQSTINVETPKKKTSKTTTKKETKAKIEKKAGKK